MGNIYQGLLPLFVLIYGSFVTLVDSGPSLKGYSLGLIFLSSYRRPMTQKCITKNFEGQSSRRASRVKGLGRGGGMPYGLERRAIPHL